MHRRLRIALFSSVMALGWSAVPNRAVADEPKSTEGVTPEVAEILRQAEEASRRKDWATANRLYADAVTKAPNNHSARFGLGASQILQGRVVEGLGEINTVIGPDPNVESLATVARVLEQAPPGSPRVSSEASMFRTRAYQKAEKEGYADSKDGERLSMMAGLALEMNQMEPFRRSTANLLRDHPRLMDTHYFLAIRSAKDDEWVAAEDAILEAGRLGLPKATVDHFLNQGVHEKAQTRRYLWSAAYAVGGWVVGLLALLLLGRVLSAWTMRSLRVNDPNAAMTPMERSIRRAYRVVIDLAGFYYYISLPMVALLAIVVAVVLGYVVFLLPRIPVKLLVLVLGFGLAMLAMIFSIVRSCFIRIKEPEPDRTLAVEEAPALWELTREVASRVGTRPIDEIWLANGTEMAVFERGNRRDKARNRSIRVLILGLEVIDGFRLDAFRAVLAHEYGHFLHRDTAGGDVAMRVQNTMGKFAQAMANQGSIEWWNLGWQFLQLYHFLFRRITHGASRLQEIHADRVASLAYGKEAFANGLRHVVWRSIETNQRRGIAFHRATSNPNGATEPAPPNHVQEASTRRLIEAEFDQRWQTNTTEDDTHPSPAERVRLLERLDAAPGEPPDGWLVDLLADPDRLLAEHQGQVDSEIKHYVAAFHDYQGNIATQLDVYIAQNPQLGGAYFERGNVRFSLGDFERAIQDYDAAIRLDAPNPAVCYFNRGVVRGRLGDVDGAEADLREALNRDPQFLHDAWAEIAEIRTRSGQFDRAIEAYNAALDATPGDADLLLKRADVHLECESFRQARSDYDRVLSFDPRCVEALVGRGRSALGEGDADRARDDLEAALRIDPNHAEAKLEWAALQGQTGSMIS